MVRMPWLGAALGAIAAVATAQADVSPVKTGFLDQTVRVGDRDHRYVVYVPPGYRADTRWPLLVFLNGMGECGTDGKRQAEVGLGPAIRLAPERWPFVVVFPQKPDKPSQWADHEGLVVAVREAAEQQFAIDPQRRYLTGLSQGGAGTWALGAKHADVWAAIAPVCGYGRPAQVAPALRAMPVWAFHGEKDNAVPVAQSKDLCAAVDAAGGRALLTLYPDLAHNSWDRAYRDEVVPEWLLAAPDARTAVFLLGDAPRRCERATLRVRVVGRASGGAKVTREASCEWNGETLAWQWSRGGAAEPQQGAGRLDAKASRERFAVWATQWLRGGVFALPGDARVAVKDTNEFDDGIVVDVEVRGGAMQCVLRRFVPTAKAGEGAAAVLAAWCDDVAARQ